MLQFFLLRLNEIKTPILNRKRAAIFVAALFIYYSFSQASDVAMAAAKVENYKDLIGKAQNLILQKDRPQALNLLNQALKQENQKTPSAIEMHKQISLISRIFLIEKAQQAYELSISMRKQDPSQALGKINEGLSLESDNLNLLLEAIRLQIIRGEYSSAAEYFNKIHKGLSSDEEVRLVQAQLVYCGNEKESEILKKAISFDWKGSHLEIYWRMLEMKKFELEKNEIKAKETLKQLLAIKDSGYPEILYWQWKLASKIDSRKNTYGQKYILSCQSLNQKQQREHLADPFLCLKKSEVEKDLKTGAPGESL